MNKFVKIIVLGCFSLAFLSGCDDDKQQNVQTYPQQNTQDYSQNQPSNAPNVVVVDGGNHSSGTSAGDVMVGAALGTMVGNALSNSGNSGYRDSDRRNYSGSNYNSRSSNKTTIINNHYNTPAPSNTYKSVSGSTGYSKSKPSGYVSPVTRARESRSFTSSRSSSKSFSSSRRR